MTKMPTVAVPADTLVYLIRTMATRVNPDNLAVGEHCLYTSARLLEPKATRKLKDFQRATQNDSRNQ